MEESLQDMQGKVKRYNSYKIRIQERDEKGIEQNNYYKNSSQDFLKH